MPQSDNGFLSSNIAYCKLNHIVLRQESDEWGILFNADTGEAYTIDPVTVFIWQQIDGCKTLSEISLLVKNCFSDLPDQKIIEADCSGLVKNLLAYGLIYIKS